MYAIRRTVLCACRPSITPLLQSLQLVGSPSLSAVPPAPHATADVTAAELPLAAPLIPAEEVLSSSGMSIPLPPRPQKTLAPIVPPTQVDEAYARDFLLRSLQEPWLWQACALGRRLTPLRQDARLKVARLPLFLSQSMPVATTDPPLCVTALSATRRKVKEVDLLSPNAAAPAAKKSRIAVSPAFLYLLQEPHPLLDAFLFTTDRTDPSAFRFVAVKLLLDKDLYAPHPTTTADSGGDTAAGLSTAHVAAFRREMMERFGAADFLPLNGNDAKSRRKKRKVLSMDWCYITQKADESRIHMLTDVVPVRDKNKSNVAYMSPAVAAAAAATAVTPQAETEAIASTSGEDAVPSTDAPTAAITATPTEDDTATLPEETCAAAQLWYERISHYTMDWNSLSI